MNKEIYKDIPNYEGLYQVSNLGNVKSLNRLSSCNRKLKEKILKSGVNNKGYLTVVLYKNNKHKTFYIHQLVAIRFLNYKKYKIGNVVNHIDFNKLNNNVNNLEIITQRENTNKKHFKSSSQYTGVSWNKKNKKWESYIRIKRKQIHLGYFNDEIDASKAYQNKLNNL